jgi:hypothetical protein
MIRTPESSIAGDLRRSPPTATGSTTVSKWHMRWADGHIARLAQGETVQFGNGGALRVPECAWTCPLLPGLLSAPLEKYAVRALALALEHVQVGERGGVEVRLGDRVLGDLAVVHEADGKVTDRHDRRRNA